MTTRSKARTTRAAKSKPAASRKRKAAPASAETTDPFRHIIVLMLENRSFDHALGALQAVIPVEGVPPAGPPRTNLDINGVPVAQLPDAIDVVRPDPKHECKDVLEQLREDNGRFVKNFQNAHPDAAPEPVMTYHKLDSLRALHKLAREFAVFDKWFSSVPGPTWTNRLFAMSGTSRGRVLMPQSVFHPHLHKYDQPSVFRRLEEAKRTHRIYRGDFPLALLLEDRRNLEAARNISTFADFLADADGSESAFPEFAFIEPRYLVNANDDHPPHPMGAGERLVSEVYEKLRANTELWESTLLVVTFDEHGGFYDHCSPDDTVPPDNRHDEYTFDRLGVRVPTIFVSPWLKQQVIGAHCDHTSLLRSLRPLGTWRHGRASGSSSGRDQAAEARIGATGRHAVRAGGPEANGCRKGDQQGSREIQAQRQPGRDRRVQRISRSGDTRGASAEGPRDEASDGQPDRRDAGG